MMIDEKKTVRANKESGFSLIELMIVVGIIGVLAAVAFPSYTQAVQKSRRADAYQALLDCAAAQTRRYTTSSPPSYLDQDGVYDAGLCGATANNNELFSPEAHYSLTIANTSCTTNGRFWCFSITATAQGTQAGDSNCASLTVDQTGRKTALPDTAGDCWRS